MTRVRAGFLILDGENLPVDGEGGALLFETFEAAAAHCARHGDPCWRPVPAWDDVACAPRDNPDA